MSNRHTHEQAQVPALCTGASSTFVSVLAILGSAFSSFKAACTDAGDKEGLGAETDRPHRCDCWICFSGAFVQNC